jgi:hypothetical protein
LDGDGGIRPRELPFPFILVGVYLAGLGLFQKKREARKSHVFGGFGFTYFLLVFGFKSCFCVWSSDKVFN